MSETIHKLTKHRYLEDDGRDHFESRGFHTGLPTHYETLCGKRFKHHFPNRTSWNKGPKLAHYHWRHVDCEECLKEHIRG